MDQEIRPLKGALGRQESAEYLSISLSEVDRLVRAGQLNKIKIGRRTIFRIVDLDDFLAKMLRAATGIDGEENIEPEVET